MVRTGELRLLLGTDAASEGLNLQRLVCLINLDLPWNPTRVEQRKGHIQRIGQVHDVVQIYNMRYKDSVEDRVHELLSGRLQNIYQLFGQLPDVLEDAWVAMALGEKERAAKTIDGVPKVHPFQLRYTHVEPVDWESCRQVLDARVKRVVISRCTNSSSQAALRNAGGCMHGSGAPFRLLQSQPKRRFPEALILFHPNVTRSPTVGPL